MKLVRKIKCFEGQQISEYTLIFVLVGIGVILMGPYVIRSWNAHLKSWQDSITDSYRDEIQHVDNPGVPLPIH